MATLVTCQTLTKAFGHKSLFRDLSLTFGDDERVGLIGPNGAGKSTLLRIIAGLDTADDGVLNIRRGLTIGYLAQEDQFAAGATARSALSDAIIGRWPDEHDRMPRVDAILDRMDFADHDQLVAQLSGGWRKRLAIARELLREPDLLLLDEPTNHLDLEGIIWLEELLERPSFAFVVVTHDRYLLDRVTNRIVEVNPAYAAGTLSIAGTYTFFLTKREEMLAGQRESQRVLAHKVRREIEWMKEGRKAQRVKDQARIDRAGDLIEKLDDLSARNSSNATARIEFDATGRRTRKLIAAEGISKSLAGRLLFRDTDVWLTPGSRVGLLGSNGSGKTTLIRVLTRELPPDSGTVRHADNLEIVVFDQSRAALPKDVTLREALAGKHDFVVYRGASLHVVSWAERFQFRKEQLISTVGDLSGGEQARILIARLMLRPADVLILDEPTNDLDIASLDVLEESLEQFPGAVVLVTHDRYMLDRLCDELIALQPGEPPAKFGSLAAWETYRARRLRDAKSGRSAPAIAAAPTTRGAEKIPADGKPAATSLSETPKRLSYKEKLEFDQMEARIAGVEARAAECRKMIEDPSISTNHAELRKWCDALTAAESTIEALYARWHELESRAG